MTALVLSLSLLASQAPFQCAWEDVACWRSAALSQLERAERAELRAKLEASAREVAERMIVEEVKRGDRWKDTAMAVAPKPPMFFETPVFWGTLGVAVGVLATVGVAYAVKPAVH